MDGSRHGSSGCSTRRSGSGPVGKLAWMFVARPLHRLRDATRRRVHERARHLRPRQSRAAEPHHDRHLHGGWHRHHADRLRRDCSDGGSAVTRIYLVLGTVFGFILSRSGAADYDFIQGMFLFTNLQLYGIIGVAVLVGIPGIWLIKRRGRTLTGRPIEIELKPLHRGNIGGGVLVRHRVVARRHVPGPDSREHRRGQDLRGRGTGRSARRRGTVRNRCISDCRSPSPCRRSRSGRARGKRRRQILLRLAKDLDDLTAVGR